MDLEGVVCIGVVIEGVVRLDEDIGVEAVDEGMVTDVDGRGLVIAVTGLPEDVVDAGTTVTIIEVESVSVVLKPSVSIVIVVTIGTVDNEIIDDGGFDGIGVMVISDVPETVMEVGTDIVGFVGEAAGVDVKLTVFDCVTVIPVIGAVVTDNAGDEGFWRMSFSKYNIAIPMTASNPPLPPIIGSCWVRL